LQLHLSLCVGLTYGLGTLADPFLPAAALVLPLWYQIRGGGGAGAYKQSHSWLLLKHQWVHVVCCVLPVRHLFQLSSAAVRGEGGGGYKTFAAGCSPIWASVWTALVK
jgi:hypothetical protein